MTPDATRPAPGLPAATPVLTLESALACWRMAGDATRFWAAQSESWARAWAALAHDGPFIGSAEASAQLLLAWPQFWAQAVDEHLRASGVHAPLLSDA
jgi:hypothetical protein